MILYRNKDQRKIYFKLKINDSYRRCFNWCFDDVKIWGGGGVFRNEHFYLRHRGGDYRLFIDIDGWVKGTSSLSIYRVNNENDQPNTMDMKYDKYTDVVWNDFRTENNECLFVLRKTA